MKLLKTNEQDEKNSEDLILRPKKKKRLGNMNVLNSYHDAQWCCEDTNRDSHANPSNHINADVTIEDEIGKEENYCEHSNIKKA